MGANSEYLRRIGLASGFLALSLWGLWFNFTGSHTILPFSIGDALFLSVAGIQLLWGIALLWTDDRAPLPWSSIAWAAEILFFYYSVLFVFAYIYAANANMDYVQRFITAGGNLQLAMDTQTERTNAALRYGPYILANGLVLWWGRKMRARLEATGQDGGNQPAEGQQPTGQAVGIQSPGNQPLGDQPAEGQGPTGQVAGDQPEKRGQSAPDQLAEGARSEEPRGDFLSMEAPEQITGFVRRWGVPLTVAGIVLTVLSFPSFVSLRGFGFLGWVALVPLFVILRLGGVRQSLWYGVVYGVFSTLLGNYWLGTFNLISLQTVGVIYLVFYVLYLLPVAGTLRYVRRGAFLVLPLSWTVFELARSSGFLGYPWLLLGHTQYLNVPLIQLASLGGVWLVGFVVALVNALIAEAAVVVVRDKLWKRDPKEGRRRFYAPAVRPLVGAAVVILAGIVVGAGMLPTVPVQERTVRVSLIQQNSDPRKHDYRRTFASLTDLTDEALKDDPDLIVWSETAFVPNIRRWSQEDPERQYLAGLVRDFLAYQDQTDTWLLTGNDDYSRVLDDEGNELERLNYNAAVLFSDTSDRVETYHKVKLVPFTEYFPYQEELPWVYEMLLEVDIHFWEPGTEYTVFEHPSVAFSTPICYEDAFPQVVRRFALAGAEMIVNISNDYWSLTEVAPKQHFVAGLFRAVELRRPVVRSTAAGLTGYIDSAGRIRETVPQYSQQYLTVDVKLPNRAPVTPYMRLGDWVPFAAAAGLIVLLALQFLRNRRPRS